MKYRSGYIGVFVTALVFSAVLNFLNLNYIRKTNPDNKLQNISSLVKDATIYSVDNVSYLPPAENILAGKGFISDPNNKFTSVRRTPGYSYFYLAHLAIFKEDALYFIRFTQLLLFALSAICLALAARNFLKNDTVALITGYLYALSPYIAGYNFFTITEAIHPEFVIFAVYAFSVAIRMRTFPAFFLTGLAIIAATLIRPSNGLLLPVTAFAGFLFYRWAVTKSFRTYLFSCFLPLTLGYLTLQVPWIIRNYELTDGDFVPLEKFYHNDPLDFGEGTVWLTKWLTSWGHEYQSPLVMELVDSLQHDKATEPVIDRFMAKVPPHVYKGYTASDVRSGLVMLRDCISFKIDNNIWRKTYKPYETQPLCDLRLIAHFKGIVQTYRRTAPFEYYVTNQVRRGKSLVFQSFAYHLAMIDAGKDLAFWQKAIKGLMYIQNALLFLSVLFMLFIRSVPSFLKAYIFLFVFITFGFYLYFLTMEARYLISCYPLMYISFAILLDHLWKRFVLKERVTTVSARSKPSLATNR